MPIPEPELLGPGFERRLKAALDKVVPPSPLLASARFRAAAPRRVSRAWRFAPALVAAGAAAMAITATAATGSPNPSVWRDRAGTVFQSVGHFPGSASPKAPSAKPPKVSPAGQGTGPSHATPPSTHEPQPKPTERPEPTDTPEPIERPEPSPTPEPQGGADTTPAAPDGN
jgi:hypothetical protein